MKFDMYEFWKHEAARDIFFKPKSIAFDDDGRNAILHGHWLNQTATSWFFIKSDRIKITPEHYNRWKPYTPKGRFKP